jgi:hypothetical protein
MLSFKLQQLFAAVAATLCISVASASGPQGEQLVWTLIYKPACDKYIEGFNEREE